MAQINLINLIKDNHFKHQKSRRTEGMAHFGVTGISCDNEFVPLYAPFVNRGIYNKQIVHYSLPHDNNYVQRPLNTYPKLYTALESSSATLRFKTRTMSFELLIIKGAIFEKISSTQADMLFSITVKEDYMIQMFKDSPMLDKSRFAMMISSRFTTEDKFKTIYRKLYKEIIVPHLDRGVDLIITKNLADKCLKSNVPIPKFRNVTQIREYLYAFNTQI